MTMKVVPNYHLATYSVWDDNDNFPADLSTEEMDRIAMAMQTAVNAMVPAVEVKELADY